MTFARTCAAEWSRLWTVQATWWFLATAAVIMNGIAVAAGGSAADQPVPPQDDAAWGAAPNVLLIAQFALLTLGIMAVTSDYATGGIVPALQWTPRRGVLFLARSIVAAGTATCLGVLLAFTCSLTDTSSVITMLVWAGGGLLLGWLRLTRDDASG